MPKTTNKLFPVIATATGLVVAALIAMYSGDEPDMKKKKTSKTKTESSRDESSVDTDSTADTLRTLAVTMDEFKQTTNEYKNALFERDAELRQLRSEIDTLRVQQSVPTVQNRSPLLPDATLVDDLLDGLATPFADASFLEAPEAESLPAPLPSADIRIGGAPNIEAPAPTYVAPILRNASSTKYRRYYPVGYQPVGYQPRSSFAHSPYSPPTTPPVHGAPLGAPLNTMLSNPSQQDTLGYITGSNASPDTSVHASSASGTGLSLSVQPYATLPYGSTLTGAITLSSLIARVPKNGNVEDPAPFKVLVGADNLAANGLKIPGLEGMIMIGTTFGDATFSCARGYIKAALFVFNDGTIRSIQADSGSGSTSSISSGNNLGYISDVRGNPCITGTFVSNAAENLLLSAGAQGLAGVAGGVAQAQTTTIQNGNSTTNSVDGSMSDFLFGQFGQAAANEVSSYLSDQQANQWDAVYVPAGVSVQIEIEQQIEIDYDPNARKLSYTPSRRPGRRGGLD